MTNTLPWPIALCITELDAGGAERFLVELATRLDRATFQPEVYCLGRRPIGAGEKLVARLEAARVPVYFFGARSVLDVWRVIGQLRAALQRQRPALVQTFLWHANVLGVIAGRDLMSRGGLGQRAPIVTGLRVAEPRRRWRWTIERWAGRWADRHVAVSDGVARFARERIGLDARKIVVIPGGVDINRFPAHSIDPLTIGVRFGRRFLLFVGRLDADDQKGAGRLLGFAPMLLNQLEGYDLVFVGDGPALAGLRRRAAKLDLEGRVHWLGWRDDVPEIIAAAGMLLAPSQWEGMSNAVLEAMASGKPIVAQNAEGIADLFFDEPPRQHAPDSGPTAFDPQVANVGDWLGFIDRIVTIARDPTLKARLGSFNRERIQQRFRLDRVVKDYERLYRELITRGRQNDDRPEHVS